MKLAWYINSEPEPPSGSIGTMESPIPMDVGATVSQMCTPIEHVTYLYKRLTVSPAGTPGHRQASKRQRHSRVPNTPTCTTDMELEVSPGTPKSYLPCLPTTEASDTAREGATSVNLRGGNESLYPSHDPQALSSDTARGGVTSVGSGGGNVSLYPSHNPQALSSDTPTGGVTSVGSGGGNVSLYPSHDPQALSSDTARGGGDQCWLEGWKRVPIPQPRPPGT